MEAPVVQITEDEARQVLMTVRSTAASARAFLATRCVGGWSFGWADHTRPIPMGVRGIVVTDGGRVRSETW